MNQAADGVRLYVGEGELQQSDESYPSGLVCVRSLRSPEKETANEDAAAVIPIGEEALVLAVADGVGGTPAGREASNAVVGTLAHMLTNGASEPMRLRSVIMDALEEANEQVIALARGAASTLVVGEVFSRQLRSYHVGDSELLTVGQRGRVKARVVPHSPTGFAVEAGLLDADEAVQHDQRHILFNVIGSPDMRVEIGTAVQLAVRDTVLLATDGLLDNLFVDEIVDIIRTGPLPAAADRLVSLARQRMSGEDAGHPSKPDDLTVILYRPHAPPRARRRKPSLRPTATEPADAVEAKEGG